MSAANALSSDHHPAPEPRAADPSMEDILASIRRIIADDQSRGLSTSPNPFRRSASPSGFAGRMETPPAEIPALDREAVPAPAGPDEAAAPARPSFAVEEDLSVIAEIVNAGAASILSPLPLEAPGAAPPAADEVIDEAATVLSLHGFETAAEERAEAPEPLVSTSVGQSVESSLQALATSVFMQNGAAVEALTRDMLRPMLKTWLDDNLPTIVERLVRIEIERVARGGRS